MLLLQVPLHHWEPSTGLIAKIEILHKSEMSNSKKADGCLPRRPWKSNHDYVIPASAWRLGSALLISGFGLYSDMHHGLGDLVQAAVFPNQVQSNELTTNGLQWKTSQRRLRERAKGLNTYANAIIKSLKLKVWEFYSLWLKSPVSAR